MLRILLKLLVVAATAVAVIASLGQYFREIIPKQHHQAAWLTGVILFCLCVFAAAMVRRSSSVKQRSLENTLLTGAIIGALLFLLFMSEMVCFSGSPARAGRISCRYLGEF
jgi:O-antigen/teichoic acid export membrane protein